MKVFRKAHRLWSLRTAAWLLVAVTSVLIVSMCSGCGATASRQAFIGVDAATDAVNGISDAAQLSPAFKAQLPAIAPYVDAVKKAQDDVDAAILANDVKLPALLQALTDATVSLLNAKAAAARAPAATLPAP